MAETTAPRLRSKRFLTLYAIANVGGVVAFNPLLALILPLKIDAIAGDARLGVLTVATLAGAAAASVASIGIGMLTDRAHARTGTRKPWTAAGLAATIASYVPVHLAYDAVSLVAAVVLFQIAVNMLLSPLFAAIADEVPDAQKGVIGGLLSCAFPVASLVGWALTAHPELGEAGRVVALSAVLALLVTPFLALARMRRAGDHYAVPSPTRAMRRIDLGFAWLSRLMVQIAASTLFTYLLFYFLTLAGGRAAITVAADVGWITGMAFLVAVPLSIAAGHASDRLAARKPFLIAATVVTAAGLLTMALTNRWGVAAAGYGLFAIGSKMFLGLHSAFTMQILPSPRHRGRDLGIINLANTFPQLIAPVLTWTFVVREDFSTLLMLVAALTLLGGLLTLPIRSQR